MHPIYTPLKIMLDLEQFTHPDLQLMKNKYMHILELVQYRLFLEFPNPQYLNIQLERYYLKFRELQLQKYIMSILTPDLEVLIRLERYKKKRFPTMFLDLLRHYLYLENLYIQILNSSRHIQVQVYSLFLVNLIILSLLQIYQLETYSHSLVDSNHSPNLLTLDLEQSSHNPFRALQLTTHIKFLELIFVSFNYTINISEKVVV